jgi:hypothetical protein
MDQYLVVVEKVVCLEIPNAPGGHSLLQLYTLCILIKNNRPPTADCMY